MVSFALDPLPISIACSMSVVSGCLLFVIVRDRVPPPVSHCDRAHPYRLGGLLPYALGRHDALATGCPTDDHGLHTLLDASDPNLPLPYTARRLPQHKAPHQRRHPQQSSVASLGSTATDGDLQLREYMVLVHRASRCGVITCTGSYKSKISPYSSIHTAGDSSHSRYCPERPKYPGRCC